MDYICKIKDLISEHRVKHFDDPNGILLHPRAFEEIVAKMNFGAYSQSQEMKIDGFPVFRSWDLNIDDIKLIL